MSEKSQLTNKQTLEYKIFLNYSICQFILICVMGISAYTNLNYTSAEDQCKAYNLYITNIMFLIVVLGIYFWNVERIQNLILNKTNVICMIVFNLFGFLIAMLNYYIIYKHGTLTDISNAESTVKLSQGFLIIFMIISFMINIRVTLLYLQYTQNSKWYNDIKNKFKAFTGPTSKSNFQNNFANEDNKEDNEVKEKEDKEKKEEEEEEDTSEHPQKNKNISKTNIENSSGFGYNQNQRTSSIISQNLKTNLKHLEKVQLEDNSSVSLDLVDSNSTKNVYDIAPIQGPTMVNLDMLFKTKTKTYTPSNLANNDPQMIYRKRPDALLTTDNQISFSSIPNHKSASEFEHIKWPK